MKRYEREIPAGVVSECRTELMAVGIILVMLCHSTLRLEAQLGRAFSVMCQFCQVGVDLFLFLSGFGIYHSLTKSDDPLKFYKKRFSRLFFSYIIVLIIWALAQVFHNITGGIIGFVYSYSLITFFLRGDMSEWYLAAIIPLYLISPWLVKYFNRKTKALPVLISVAFLLSFAFMGCAKLFSATKYGLAFSRVNELMIIRLPSFLMGMHVAKVLCQGNVTNVGMKKAGAILLAGIVLFVLNTVVFPGKKLFLSQWYISRAIFGLICIPLILMIGHAIGSMNKNSWLRRMLRWLGVMTFELYLLHVKVLAYLDSLLPETFLASVISNVLAIMISVLIAFLINKAVKRTLGLIERCMKKKHSP